MHPTTTIYVELLDELVEVYRPVAAEHLYGDIYRIVDPKADSEEVWRFPPGAVVCCRLTRFQGRADEVLVAIEEVRG
ncbi:MAG TPA: hypothetical protein VFY71_06805 [Planctomycetota bacterium]|nr:hypothetical protein [Planctomycetota bacterium]